jgi:hypothetical protein
LQILIAVESATDQQNVGGASIANSRRASEINLPKGHPLKLPAAPSVPFQLAATWRGEPAGYVPGQSGSPLGFAAAR